MHEAWHRDCGLSLIEMIVVIAIIAVGVAMVMPLSPHRSEASQMLAATQRLSADLHMLRTAARRDNAMHEAVIDLQSGTYGSDLFATRKLPTGPRIRLSATSLGQQLADRTVRIAFTPDGSARDVSLRLSDGTVGFAVTVDGFTGMTTRERLP
jgi:general secretion pathway protein H